MTWLPIAMVAVVVLLTVGMGFYTARSSRTASDFFVAGRSVSVFWNASAISGEYLSAASFMGVAGFVMRYGYDALWYPVGYATGYLFLLLFIAGPLRRFGAYTIPDFAEGRFHSRTFRKIAVSFVLFIGFFYTMPQMKGAGVTMTSVLGTPYWVGVLLVGGVISLNVALGGMKGITLVQAFQYWLKAFAISLPIIAIAAVVGPYPKWVAESHENNTAYPRLVDRAERTFKAGDTLTLPPVAGYELHFVNGAKLKSIAPARKPQPGEDPMASESFLRKRLDATGNALPEGSDLLTWPPGSMAIFGLTPVRVGGVTQKDGQRVKNSQAKLEFAEPARVAFTDGAIAAGTVPNGEWIQPYGALTKKHGHPLLYTFSLIVGLIFGTAGLPHILVRFYTNPDGRAAKRTTLWVMVLIGLFYLFPAIWGATGRHQAAHLYANTKTDAVVLELPRIIGGDAGEFWRGVTCAGAFAAFMSTFSGLLVSMSGAMAHDIYGTLLRPQSSARQRLLGFKFAALGIGVVATLLGLIAETWDIAMLVGWAFAIAACSYFPLLLLGSWWRGLTEKGAATGMLVGGLAALGSIITTMLIDAKHLQWTPDPILRTLMEQPAIWGVPLSLGLMVVVSRFTAAEIPPDVDQIMLRLHAPEELGLAKDYIAEVH